MFVGLLPTLGSLTPIRADYIQVAGGQIYNGRFAGIVGDRYVLQTPRGRLSFPIVGSDLQIGNDGVRACVHPAPPAEPRCDHSVFYLGRTSVLMGEPRQDGSFEGKRMVSPTTDWISLSVASSFPQIESNVVVALLTEQGRVRGRWLGVSGELVRLRSASGSVVEVQKASIRQLEYGLADQATQKVEIPSGPVPLLLYVFPGAPAVYRGDVFRGLALAFGAVGFSAASYNEYRQAQFVASQARRDLIYLYYRSISGRTYEADFDGHVRRYQGFGAAALLVYGLHFWEALWQPDPVAGGGPGTTRAINTAQWFARTTLPELGHSARQFGDGFGPSSRGRLSSMSNQPLEVGLRIWF